MLIIVLVVRLIMLTHFCKNNFGIVELFIDKAKQVIINTTCK